MNGVLRFFTNILHAYYFGNPDVRWYNYAMPSNDMYLIVHSLPVAEIVSESKVVGE